MDQDESNYYLKYDSVAETTKIEDITSDEQKVKILRRLKSNKTSLKKVWLCHEYDQDGDFAPSTADELGWFGYYIGNNTALKDLSLEYPDDFDGIEAFCRGVSRNRSIEKIHFYAINQESDSNIFPKLLPFFKHNNSLTEISFDSCDFAAGCSRQLALALGGCHNNSIKCIKFGRRGGEADAFEIADIIIALSMHPQLETLQMKDMDIGRNECMALSTLLKCTVKNLQTLNLSENDIDGEAVEFLAGALASNESLQHIDLSVNDIGDRGADAIAYALQGNTTLRKLDLSQNNPVNTITIKGWKSLAALLYKNNCCLKELHLHDNEMGDEGACVFAEALASNSKLKSLGLVGNSITAEGWSAFSTVLCDTSSVNNTHLSNHTLEYFAGVNRGPALPSDVISYLSLNRNTDDKTEIAIKKIIGHHSHFNMQPLFEWDFKALPRIIDWFTKAFHARPSLVAKVRRIKLDSIYQFVRGMPMLYIEAHTRNQLEEIRAKRMRWQWEQMELESRLEEAEREEARALRRL